MFHFPITVVDEIEISYHHHILIIFKIIYLSEREREVSQLLVHSADPFSNRRWARPDLRAGNSIWASQLADRDLFFTRCLQGAQYWEAGTESITQARTQAHCV